MRIGRKGRLQSAIDGCLPVLNGNQTARQGDPDGLFE